MGSAKNGGGQLLLKPPEVEFGLQVGVEFDNTHGKIRSSQVARCPQVGKYTNIIKVNVMAKNMIIWLVL